MSEMQELMTAEETIAYLRLDALKGDARERLRNLTRRQGLPVIRRGKLRLFRRSAVDAWLDAGTKKKKTWCKDQEINEIRS